MSKMVTSKEEVLDIVEKAMLFFREQGKQGERFSDTIARIGFDQVEKMILADDLLQRKEEILAKEIQPK